MCVYCVECFTCYVWFCVSVCFCVLLCECCVLCDPMLLSEGLICVVASPSPCLRLASTHGLCHVIPLKTIQKSQHRLRNTFNTAKDTTTTTTPHTSLHKAQHATLTSHNFAVRGANMGRAGYATQCAHNEGGNTHLIALLVHAPHIPHICIVNISSRNMNIKLKRN